MNELAFGIITFVLSGMMYLLAWRYQQKQLYLPAILLLIAGGLFLRVFAACDLYLHPWDERFHALVAKNLIRHPLLPTLYDQPLLDFDYRSWITNHVWLHKQPLPLWGMAASMSLFGINEFALRLPSIILTSVGIYFTYVIGRHFFDRKSGFLAAFFFSVNGLIIELMAGRVPSDHVDIFFLFFIEAAIFFTVLFVRRRRTVFNILAGICLGAAILSKWLPALIVLPVWLMLIMDAGAFSPRKIMLHFLLMAALATLVFLPWQIYIFRAFPLEAAWESNFNFRHLTEVIEGRGGPFYFFLDTMRINYGELIYLPMIWFLWQWIRKPLDHKLLALGAWIFIPLLFFSIAATKMQAYILFISPALFIITARFFFVVYEFGKDHRYRWAFLLLLFIFIAIPLRYAVERVKPFSTAERNPQWVKDLRAFQVAEPSRAVLFNYPHPIEAMFYTDMTVYAVIPAVNKIAELQENGFTIYVYDQAPVPEAVMDAPGVIMTDLKAVFMGADQR